MPNAVRSPPQIRVTIAVGSIEQISGSTAVRADGNVDTGILAGQRITLSGCSVSSYNTTHTVTATGSDGTGPYLVLGNTIFDGTDSQGAIEGQLEPITVLHGKTGTAGVQITKRSDGSHQLGLLEGGQGGGGGGGGSNTLDQAYDQGGAGAGRSIDVNSGALTFTNAAGTNSILQLEQGVSGQNALHVIHATGASAGTSTGMAIEISATQRDLAAPIFELSAGESSTTTPVFTITGREAVANESGSPDISFRAEADTTLTTYLGDPSSALFVNGGTGYIGAGTSGPQYNFHAKGGTTYGAGLLLETQASARNSALVLGNSAGTSGTFSLGTSTYGMIWYQYDNTGNKPGFMAFDRFGDIIFNAGQGRTGQLLRPDFKIHPAPTAGGVAIGFDSAAMPTFGGDCLAVGHHPAGVMSDRALMVGRECSASDHSVAIGSDCFAANSSLALGVSADTSTYSTDPVLAMNNGSSAGTGGGSTANTIVLDSGNQAPAGAISIGGTGGNGNIYVEAGGFFSGAADYAEMFEWFDGNGKQGSQTDINLGGPGALDRRGLFVSLVPQTDKIQIGISKQAAPGAVQILGVTTGRPAIVGDAATLSWTNKYELDDFGAVKTIMNNGKKENKVNPNYNSTKQYLPRSQRTEWTAVGLLGKLFVRCSDPSVQQAGDWVRPDISTGMAVASGSKQPYAEHRQGLGFHYQVLRVMRPATKLQYGIVEILLVR